jgi:hypothetical protein
MRSTVLHALVGGVDLQRAFEWSLVHLGVSESDESDNGIATVLTVLTAHEYFCRGGSLIYV